VAHLRVIPVVEGHGEVESVRLLIERIVHELIGRGTVEVLQPIRRRRGNLVKQQEIERAVEFAARKLGTSGEEANDLILVLLDADDDCPAELAPLLVEWASAARRDRDTVCVLAKREFETWFVAAAASLGERLDLPDALPDDPEHTGQGKAWIQRPFSGVQYSPSIDQPGLTARMDLALCRARSPSFDKLCREIEKRL